MINKVKFNDQEVNEFAGMYGTLTLYQKCSKGIAPSKMELMNAWREASTPDKKALLFTVLFFVGDVTGRQHNMLPGKVDKGGNAEREVFRDVLIPFLVSKTKKFTKVQKRQLAFLVMEYTTLDNVVAARIQTKKMTKNVTNVINMIEVFGETTVLDLCNWIITKGSHFHRTCLAKFLTRPRLTKRSKSTKMLSETLEVMKTRFNLIKKISDTHNFLIERKGKQGQRYIVFTGFFAWRKKFNTEFESVLFSSGKIKEYDKMQFHALLEKMPSDARFRVRNRVLFDEKNKWGSLGVWYKEWETFKENAQTEQRDLEAKIVGGSAVDADELQIKLAEVKKKAQVNSGSVNFLKMFDSIVQGKVDRVAVQPFLDKVVLPYNTLVFVDNSGSMKMSWNQQGRNYTPRDLATFMATICLTKNPDAEARNLLGLFSIECQMYNGISTTTTSSNSLMVGKKVSHPSVPLIKEEDHFLDNLDRMRKFVNDNQRNFMTNVASIPEDLNKWINGDPHKLEMLQNYPVWTLISDGNFNQMSNSTSSALDFMAKCEKYFGFRPFIILIDVAGDTSSDIKNFVGVEGMMMVPPNPMNIELILTHFKDMQAFDVFTPLQSLFSSSRYDPVKDLARKGKF